MGVLTVRQAADRLQVAAATIYDLCARKVLRHIRVGRGRGTIRIREDDLDAFVETATVQPIIPAAPRPGRLLRLLREGMSIPTRPMVRLTRLAAWWSGPFPIFL